MRSRGKRWRLRPSPAMVVSVVALFVALSGSALALQANSVRSRHIVDGAVKSRDLKSGAVERGKLAGDAVDSVKVADGTLTGFDLASNAVTSSKILNGTVRAPDLGQIRDMWRRIQVQPRAVRELTISCPTGSRVISGGAESFAQVDVSIWDSHMSGNGWRVEARNNDFQLTRELTVHAYCLLA